MRYSSIIGHTVEVLSAFRENPSIPADAVLRRFFIDRKYLGSTDRRAIADFYYGIIRNSRRLDERILHSFPDKQLTSARMAAAYMAIMGSDPSMILTAFEELNVPFLPSSIERLADPKSEQRRLDKVPPDERLAILYSFPLWFAKRIGAEYGVESLEPILSSLNKEAPTSLRANTLLTTREKLSEELEREGCATEPAQTAPDALHLLKRVNISELKSFRQGKFEIQDEGSQLVVPFANFRKTAIKVLDACAGAGGKTLHLSALMKNRGEIYATDADPYKLKELAKRSRRAGAQNIRIVLPDESEKRLGNKTGWFDLVLLDVPCTGTGTIRRNPGIKWLLTEEMLDELVEKQRNILETNASFVKPGGTLLYSTCSLLKEESEDQMKWFTRRHPEFSVEETLRTRPDTQDMDGFFVARLRKSGAFVP